MAALRDLVSTVSLRVAQVLVDVDPIMWLVMVAALGLLWFVASRD